MQVGATDNLIMQVGGDMIGTDVENPFIPKNGDSSQRGRSTRSLYQILDVSSDANRADIRSAYIRKKSSLSSMGGASYSLLDTDDHSAAMKELEDAYRVLDDMYLRKKYDQDSADAAPVPRPSIEGARRKPLRVSSRVAESSRKDEVKAEVSAIIAASDTVSGALVRQIRETVGVDDEEVFKNLKISNFYLKILEEDDFSQLPPPVYVRGFLKSLLEYLGVSEVKEIVDGYSRNLQEWKKKNDKKNS